MSEFADTCSPYHEPTSFEQDGTNCDGRGNMQVSQSRAYFEPFFGSGNDRSVDPQLLAGTASRSNNSLHGWDGQNDFGEFVRSQPTSPSLYSAPDLHTTSFDPMLPHYQPSVDGLFAAPHQAPYFHPTAHHEHHRRSVSEPPFGLDDSMFGEMQPPFQQHSPVPFQLHPGRQNTVEPSVVFHRSGHVLGTPKPLHSNAAKLKGRSKNSEAGMPCQPHPDGRKVRAKAATRPRRNRADTQTARSVIPTSAPYFSAATSVPMSSPRVEDAQPLRCESPLPGPASRVCTPAPSTEHADTLLQSPPKSMVPAYGNISGISVEELRLIVTQAVQDAIMGIEVQRDKEDIQKFVLEDEHREPDARKAEAISEDRDKPCSTESA